MIQQNGNHRAFVDLERNGFRSFGRSFFLWAEHLRGFGIRSFADFTARGWFWKELLQLLQTGREQQRSDDGEQNGTQSGEERAEASVHGESGKKRD